MELAYAVVYEPSDTGWGAYVPDLPGCVAVGTTIEETRRLIREAIALYLEVSHESGYAVSAPVTQVELVPAGSQH